jgi:CreA protein
MTQQQQQATATRPPFEYANALVISVGVKDLDRAIDWYRDMLGFELVYQLDDYGWCEVSSPITGVTIGLGQNEQPKVAGNVPTWSVKDIAAARSHLESNGVRFDGETQQVGDMVKLATFYDPDGNPWMLAESMGSADQPA